MSFYQSFTAVRSTEPDWWTLLTQLKNANLGSGGVQHTPGTPDYVIKKDTEWTEQNITDAQTILNTAPAVTDRLQAQGEIDHWPIAVKALVLALVDEINILRQKAGLAQRTVQQAINAIRDKAATL